MEKPLISMLMNCYNGEEFLHDSITSVINQTYDNWELVFWDNQSNDSSKQIFQSYSDKRLKYYSSNDHSKLGEARRRAFEHLKGKFVAVLDTDDIWYPTKLEKQITGFKDPEVGIVISNAYFFNKFKKTEIFKSPPFQGWVFNKLLENYYVCLATLMFRKKFVTKLKKQFDSEFNYIADFDLVLRLSKISKLKYIDEILAGWRAHGQNHTFKSPYKFVEETSYWIKKQQKLNFLNSIQDRESINILLNKHNRQLAIFELINGNRINCIKKILRQKNKNIKDLIVLFAALSFISKNIIKSNYLKRISLGLVN